MPTGQEFRSFLTSNNNNREVNPVNASTPNARFDMKKLVQEPGTAAHTFDMKALRKELKAVSVELRKMDQKIVLVEDNINTVEQALQVVFQRKFGKSDPVQQGTPSDQDRAYFREEKKQLRSEENRLLDKENKLIDQETMFLKWQDRLLEQ
jgi:hypothetical protein